MMTAQPTPPIAPDFTTPKLVFRWKEALLIVLCMVVMKVGKVPGTLLVGVLLILWSLRNSTAAFQTLTLLAPLSTLSSFFIPAGFSGALKWLGIFIASISALYYCLRNSNPTARIMLPRWLLTFLLFLATIVLISVGGSADVSISLFKLLTFAVGVFGLMAACWDRRFSLDYCLSWLYTFYVTVLGSSLLLIVMKAAYFPNTRYFMGIFNQSQAYALFVVPFTTFLLARWVFGRAPSPPLERILCICGMFTLFLSNSRTAGISLLGAMTILFLVGFTRKVIDGPLILRRVMPIFVVLTLLAVALNVVTNGGVGRRIQSFINKGGVQMNSMLGSREVKFREAFNTFRTHIWTGKGFGLSVGSEKLDVKYDKTLGIPISAPVEGGVMYMALPAQIGIIGLIPFLAFVVAYAVPIARHAPLPILGLSLCAMLTNTGEYTFFAMGGLGLYLWVLFAFAHRYSAVCGNAGDT